MVIHKPLCLNEIDLALDLLSLITHQGSLHDFDHLGLDVLGLFCLFLLRLGLLLQLFHGFLFHEGHLSMIFELLLFSLIFRWYLELLNRESPNLFPGPRIVLDNSFREAADHIADDTEGVGALIGRLASL